MVNGRLNCEHVLSDVGFVWQSVYCVCVCTYNRCEEDFANIITHSTMLLVQGGLNLK